MKAKQILAMFVMTLFLVGCMTTSKRMTMTPLEIQSMQSREYESTKEIVFRSVVSVFQDIGYTITNAHIKTGIISAESSSNSNSSMAKFLLGINKVTQTKATGFVEQIGSMIKVRLSFVEVKQSSSGSGQTDRQDTQIINAKIYENAFDKIENAIFVRSAN